MSHTTEVRVERLRSPLVGRERELDRLRASYRRTGAGEGGALVLWGSAGVGKSRLLVEFGAWAAGEGARVGGGSCFEYVCPPFGPFVDAFRALGLDEAFAHDAPAVASAAAAEAAKHRRFSTVFETLRATAAQDPLVVMLDDVQWADLTSLELLSFLARGIGSSKVLLIAAVRSDDLERDAVRFEMVSKLQRDALATLDVEPLSDIEMRRLIENLWPSESRPGAAELARLCELAEGRPYFAEELVRSAAFRPSDESTGDAPPSIRSSVLARFARLSPDQRRVVSHAAAIGRRFDAALLAEIVSRDERDVWNALSAARDAQLVREARGAVGSFVFRHAITREVIYREMLAPQARAIHAEVAARLALQAGTDASELAHHWAAAGEHARAAEAFERAGDAAMSRNAAGDALVAYRGAATQRAEGDVSPALCEKLARTYSMCGEVAESLPWSHRAVDGYVAGGRRSEAAALLVWLSRRLYELAQADAAAATAERALELLGEKNDDWGTRFEAHVTLASFETLQGRTESAAAHLAEAEKISAGRSPDSRSGFHVVRAMFHAASFRVDRAFEDFEAALPFARESDDAGYVVWTLNNYASRATESGRMDLALPTYVEALGIVEALGRGKLAALVYSGYAFAQLIAGDLAKARASLERGSALGTGGAMTQNLFACIELRIAYLEGDDLRAAQFWDDREIERLFESGEAQIIGLLAGCMAPYLEVTGRPQAANRLRSRALERLNGASTSQWLLDQIAERAEEDERVRAREILAEAATDPGNAAAAAHLALFDAAVEGREGRRSAAKRFAAEAAERYAAIGWPWEEARALERGGEPARALEIYRRFGFARDAERVEQARRRVRHRPSARALTPRELDVIRLAVAGQSNRAIAEQLFISERTVESHIAAVFDRFALTSRVQLAGLIEK